MALTTSSQEQFSFNPATRRPKLSDEAAILLDKSIVARPLFAPEVASIHVKNTGFYYRWVNRLHGHGQVYMKYKAMGFVNATSDDVAVLVGDTVTNESEIVCGDVILMKIDYALWASHAKRNMETAQILQRMRGVQAKDDLGTDVFDEGGRPRHENLNESLGGSLGKTSTFIPDNPDAIIDGQNAADTDKVRATVAELRKKHAAERK